MSETALDLLHTLGDTPRAQTLLAAAEAVLHDRQLEHGPPEDCMASIATIWQAWLDIRRPGPLTAFDAAEMLSLFKKARKAHNPHHQDSHTDDVGYSAISAECAARMSPFDQEATRALR